MLDIWLYLLANEVEKSVPVPSVQHDELAFSFSAPELSQRLWHVTVTVSHIL